MKQLKFQFGVDMKELAVSVPPVIAQGNEGIKVEKRGEVMEKLLQMYTGDGVKSLSASALNNYISCPLKFYVENVEGIAD